MDNNYTYHVKKKGFFSDKFDIKYEDTIVLTYSGSKEEVRTITHALNAAHYLSKSSFLSYLKSEKDLSFLENPLEVHNILEGVEKYNVNKYDDSYAIFFQGSKILVNISNAEDALIIQGALNGAALVGASDAISDMLFEKTKNDSQKKMTMF